jgi:hypothetical protein
VFKTGERERNEEDPCREMRIAVAVDINQQRYRNDATKLLLVCLLENTE